MNKETFLHIEEPCHQNWNAMSKEEQGRFCQSCSKTVIDFTHLSDKEVLQVLQKAAGNTCGRFTEDQLHRPFYEQPPRTSKSYRIFLSAFIPTVLIANSAIAQSKGVELYAVLKTTTLDGSPARRSTDTTRNQPKTIIKGEISRLPNLVEVREVMMGKVQVSRTPILKETTVKEDIEPDTIVCQPVPLSSDITPAPLELSGALGEVVVYRKVSKIDTVKTIIRKAFSQQAFKVYANPASVGGTVEIKFKEAGSYIVQLLDASGRLYLSKSFEANDAPISFKLPSHALAGSYYIKAINKSRKSYVDDLFIK